MPQGRTPITWNMTVRDALLNVINEDMAELFSRVEALELGVLSGVAIATEEEAIAGVDNSKAMTPLRTRQAFNEYVSLGVNADTLDGDHSTAFRRKDENINLSQGQIVDFADEAGDKIRLYGTQYGVAVNPNELTLYAPSTSDIAVRDSAYNGQKLGEVIHTGNIDSKGLARRIGLIESTAGDFLLREYSAQRYIPQSATPFLILGIYIPWTGTMRYRLSVYGNSSDPPTVTIMFNSTEYGPYILTNNVTAHVYIDHPATGSVNIYTKSSNPRAFLLTIGIYTGSPEVVYELMTTYCDSDVITSIVYPLEAAWP